MNRKIKRKAIDLQLFADTDTAKSTNAKVDFASVEALLKDLNEKVERKSAEDKENIESMVREAVRLAMDKPQRKAGFDLRTDMVDINPKQKKDLLYKKTDPALRELHDIHDNLYIVSQVLGVSPKSVSLWNEYDYELRKTLGTDVVGEGAEWVPTGFSATLIEEVRLALRVAALHTRIDMPRDPFNVPGHRRAVTARRVGEGQEITTAGTVGTRQITLASEKLMTWVPFPYELDEDSIIAILPIVRSDIVGALADAIETATINGDVAEVHQDTDVTDADDARTSWDGYRKLAIADVDLATFNLLALREIRKAMGKYGVQPSQLAWVTGISGYTEMLNLGEVMTLDKYGSNATVLTGELGRIDNIPIVVSEFVREDLNAEGFHDGVTADKTEIILVYRPGFIYGDRRQVMVETDRNIKSQTVDLVASQRLDFQPRYESDTEAVVARGISLAV